MNTFTVKGFCEESTLPESLIRATIRQVGGWARFKECANEIASHSADAGWPGFTYYEDTVPFSKKNKESILEMARNQADDLGTEMFAMISNFRCMNGLTATEVIEAIYSRRSPEDNRTTVFNGMAWYALEEVARAYDDLFPDS